MIFFKILICNVAFQIVDRLNVGVTFFPNMLVNSRHYRKKATGHLGGSNLPTYVLKQSSQLCVVKNGCLKAAGARFMVSGQTSGIRSCLRFHLTNEVWLKEGKKCRAVCGSTVSMKRQETCWLQALDLHQTHTSILRSRRTVLDCIRNDITTRYKYTCWETDIWSWFYVYIWGLPWKNMLHEAKSSHMSRAWIIDVYASICAFGSPHIE